MGDGGLLGMYGSLVYILGDLRGEQLKNVTLGAIYNLSESDPLIARTPLQVTRDRLMARS